LDFDLRGWGLNSYRTLPTLSPKGTNASY
jgi:hypothetical protein